MSEQGLSCFSLGSGFRFLMRISIPSFIGLMLSGCLFCDRDSVAEATPPAPLPNFADFVDVAKKKDAFISYMTPLVVQANRKVLAERALVEKMLNWKQRGRWIRPVFLDQLIQLSNKYRVRSELLSDAFFDEMLLKIDEVPLSLALAQAATESGWGTSRFARKGNNLFGQWCFKTGCGLIPQARDSKRRHEVARFDTPLDSVESYVLNLNRHKKYKGFREERATLRREQAPLSGLILVSELRHYSERRDAYVDEIKNIIQGNDLDAFDS